MSGDNITPDYLHRPDATEAAFGEDGFYRTGDAVALVDPDYPNQGLMIEGRLAEDFKLTTGTWVSVATVRTALLHAAPALSDAVIAGHDRAEVTALAWLDPAEVRKRRGLTGVTADHPVLRGHLVTALSQADHQVHRSQCRGPGQKPPPPGPHGQREHGASGREFRWDRVAVLGELSEGEPAESSIGAGAVSVTNDVTRMLCFA